MPREIGPRERALREAREREYEKNQRELDELGRQARAGLAMCDAVKPRFPKKKKKAKRK